MPAADRHGAKTSWVHIATSLYTDVQPCVKLKIPVIWVEQEEGAARGTEEADAEVKDLRVGGEDAEGLVDYGRA